MASNAIAIFVALFMFCAGCATDQAWVAQGFDGAQTKRWRRVEFSPEQARRWNDAGFTDPGDAAQWASYLSEPREAAEWRRVGFTAHEAGWWIQEKVGRDEALKRKKDWEGRIRATCPGGIRSVLSLVQMNPFDTEGVCFEVVVGMGLQLQLLSRTQALYDVHDSVFLVDFGSASAPGVVGVTVFARGESVFRYRTTIGAEKIVPHLRVVADPRATGP
jgi:hypothetical protein